MYTCHTQILGRSQNTAYREDFCEKCTFRDVMDLCSHTITGLLRGGCRIFDCLKSSNLVIRNQLTPVVSTIGRTWQFFF